MKQLLFVTAFLFSCIIAQAQDALLSGFKNPPSSSRARTWWHWIDGNITKAGITADLEAMHRVGIQEAQIFNVGQGYPQGAVTYLSPEWLDLFKFAVTEAKRLNMELAFHNGPGWSSSGGPWVKPGNAMQTVVYSQTQVQGGKVINQVLPQPATKFDYYKDIVVLAFPTPKGNKKIDLLGIKSLSGGDFKTHLEPNDKVIDPASIIVKNSIIDLSSKMSVNGNLNWAAPAGDWTIIRFGHTPNGTENHPSEKGGAGLEIDKMSRAAVDTYWADGIKPILDKVGPLVGNTLNNCLVDSYEVGCDNWTEGFNKEFKKRRQYDCLTYLPTLAGYYVESGEVSERFLWDFRRTIGDLMADNYYAYFAELCHKNKMKFSTEPYGGPFESMQTGAPADVVMGEFWLTGNDYSESARMAASVAHIKGNSIVGAESFTSIGGWANYPATMKPLGDRMWTEGINRFIFHSYPLQPWNVAPGVTFHQWGVEMSRLNTWWEQSRAYMSYLAHSQFLLQQGHSTADILIFNGEDSPNDAILRNDVKRLGVDYDQIGPDELQRLMVKNGRIYTHAGLPYRLLVLPNSTWATPQLLTKIKELVAGGATIIGPKPTRSPSLQGYPACDEQVTRLSNELWNGKISPNLSVYAALKRLNITPDFSDGATGSDLNFIHRAAGNDDIYFISNPQTNARQEVCRFRVAGKKPQLWNPETGKAKDILVWQKGPGNTTDIPLSFNTNGATFVVFRGANTSPAYHIADAKVNLDHSPLQPLPSLKIIKAEYGVFLPDGLIEVTDALAKNIKSDGLLLAANNGLAGDPAAGSVKEMRVEYELDDKRHQVTLLENEKTDLQFNGQQFKLIRALYGKFPADITGIPPKYPITDVTAKLNDLVNSNNLMFSISDKLFDVAPAENDNKRELHLTYSTNGEIKTSNIHKGNIAHLERDMPQPELVYQNGAPEWVTPYAGKVTYKTIAGATKTAVANKVMKPIELTGAWDISFPKNTRAPAKATFEKLISWPTSDDEGIKYFSGTATYKKQFILTRDVLKEGNSLELDLGSVGVIAEVIVNGKNLGVLWKIPFRVDLTSAVHAGKNDIEINVTNLWRNRLVGDAHIPSDVKYNGSIIGEWPTWINDVSKRDSKRTTFVTFNHWDANSPLQASGLMGPVIIRSYQHIKLAE
ncbi:glycosyl hydrolase [Mucilaginibacter ximonensis]|uniref:Glycosyl hydrolase n=1 Tax=Mucilaginibacter ximonensis TaxID=538021 RepID=A0ABW5Y7T0_9SPHI